MNNVQIIRWRINFGPPRSPKS